MINEDYVSFETAKLLKEKGFKIPYDSFRGVYINGIFKRLNPGDGYAHNFRDEIVDVCSLQMAMKWLRETYNIHPNIVVEVYGPCATYMIDRIFDGNEEKWVDFKSDENPSNIYSKREEACEAAIKYCLENLI